ncbi:MAG: Gmad2 immunoglobulin-like domain-containing protein [Bacillota bacterium]|jgi:hypothetical protein|nr:Gmad2 immunoglobulin-like domain-containing protein [Bacillota bacterium]HHU29639.1 protease complex subunit PrcB family protein [Bacillota bacterium]
MCSGRKACLLFLGIFFLILLAICAGCGRRPSPQDNGNTGNDNNNSGSEEEISYIEQEINSWIENSKEIFLGQSREIDGKQYILVTYGKKESNGYTIDIVNTEVMEDHVAVYVEFARPAEGEVVESVENYPYDLETIEATGLPVRFYAGGDEDRIPLLLGCDYLLPVKASSAGIKIFNPGPQEEVGRLFAIEGVANVFEGNFQYSLADSSGKVLAAGYYVAAMGDWQYFSIELEIEENFQLSPPLRLEFFTESPRDGSRENIIKMALQFND